MQICEGAKSLAVAVVPGRPLLVMARVSLLLCRDVLRLKSPWKW